ncbi:MAG: selenide, water dikinase SelD [Bacteroidota bacterium]
MQTGEDKIFLTQHAHGAGCGCKIAPQVLEEILQSDTARPVDKNLLVGNRTNDDAAVYDLGNGKGLIATTDFFTPIVDDAYDFGRVAAANAISDVYAMGGTPSLALAILGWPVNKLPASLAKQVLEGARTICDEAGIPLAGGHSIDTAEPMFGLSVNGLIDLENLKKNNTAGEGDLIFMTKPLGTGILSTAQKRKVLTEEDQTLLIKQLTRLNAIGEKLGRIKGVTAMTDVTGFGLLGHLLEMAEGSGLSAHINYSLVPKIPSVAQYIKLTMIPDATYRNWNAYSKKVFFDSDVDAMEAFSLLPDPQTNGGLLFSVEEKAAKEVTVLLQGSGYGEFVKPIGRIEKRGEKTIRVLK